MGCFIFLGGGFESGGRKNTLMILSVGNWMDEKITSLLNTLLNDILLVLFTVHFPLNLLISLVNKFLRV